MFANLLCFVILVLPSVWSAVAKDVVNTCSLNEYMCSDGVCISAELACDGQPDCPDRSDETDCEFKSIYFENAPGQNRSKRQLSSCRKNEWQCRDGSCIQFDGKCDGVVDCQDRSDEAHSLCWQNKCQSNWFRCTYGACVDGTAPCNNIQECADNSDELLPRCRNETLEVRGKFNCSDGSIISASNHCDGVKDCPDGSDETLRSCADKTCPSHLYQCEYGACVDSGANCNHIQECADNSDEADCGESSTPIIKPTSGNCILPPYPEHGTYTTNIRDARPGLSYKYVTVNVTCQRGYGVDGPSVVGCQDGRWQENIPKCIRQCRVQIHPSVEYHCIVNGAITGIRACNTYEPVGTTIQPECRRPNYYYPYTLTLMRCIDGYWDYTARCNPECGTVTPDGIDLIYGGVKAKRGEIPWHAGIYQTTFNPYMQICGGSLISRKIVISAAHCFWTDLGKQMPAENYAVALGKLYRPWNDPMDKGVQKSDVKEIHIPDRFQGAGGSFQDDIAILIVKEEFEYMVTIRPVCLSFDVKFESQQLQTTQKGKVAGWGVTSANGKASPLLQVVELPYVEVGTCLANSPPAFKSYITSDKICAGTSDSTTAVCKGDSGGGLAFPTEELAVQRYYLRGIVSTAPNNDNVCNTATFTAFTQIKYHETFIKKFWTEA